MLQVPKEFHEKRRIDSTELVLHISKCPELIKVEYAANPPISSMWSMHHVYSKIGH